MIYYAPFEEIAVTAAQDFFEILCPTDAVIKILEVRIGQSSDPGDAQAEMLPISFVRGHGTVTSGAGGGTITPVPVEKGASASGATVERNNTTKMVAGSGTLVTLYNDAFNAQVGFLWQATPETQIVVSPGDRFTVELVTAPVDSLDMNGTIVYEEIGG